MTLHGTSARPAHDRAGPLFLLALIAGAFVPSLLMQFDLSALEAALLKALGQGLEAICLTEAFPAGPRHADPASLPQPLQAVDSLDRLTFACPGPHLGPCEDARPSGPLPRPWRMSEAPSPRSPPLLSSS